MEDIKKADQKLWIQEAISPGRIVGTFFALLFVVPVQFIPGVPLIPRVIFGALALTFIGLHFRSAFIASVARRFRNRRFEALWRACKDRLERYEEVLGKMRKEQVADFQEMPKTVRRISETLYAALRRADMISHEVMLTEKGIYSSPANWNAATHDHEAKQLYQLADKNIAEYRQHFAGVMAGVQRTEAQAAVYMTTLDTLRMKMIGYRLVGKSPELSTDEFVASLHEAKLQLLAIDQALEELDFKSVPPGFEMPPPVPEEFLQQHQGSQF